MLRLLKLAVKPQGANLEMIGAVDEIGAVKRLVKSAGKILAVVEGDPAFLVDKETEIPFGPLLDEFNRPDAQPEAFGRRLCKLPRL